MNIVVIFGGASVEHDVSILTGLHAAKNISHCHQVELLYLTRTGQMVTSERDGILSCIDYFINGNVEKAPKCFFSDGCLYKKTHFGSKKIFRVDAVLNCCHGGVGEDGRLAAMFDVLGIPITSCNSVAAYNMQSKSRTREILTANGFPQPQYKKIERGQTYIVDKKDPFGFPVIVKPDMLGSSIGISVVHNQKELDEAIELGFSVDDTVIIEQFFENVVEINCSAMRYGNEIMTSGCEIMDKGGDILDFNKKYIDSQTGFIKKGKRDEKVHEKEEEIKEITKSAYELFKAKGVIRADFLIQDGKVYLNEINTVPGFLAYHLWLKVGLPYTALIEMMIEQAMKSSRNDIKTSFKSDILQKNRILVQ